MKIIYETDKGLAVMSTANELSIEHILNKDVPEEYRSSAHIVEDSIIPEDLTLSYAMKYNGQSIYKDVDRLKVIWKERLRLQRKPLLENLDILFMRTLEKGEDVTAIVSEKNRLRDITNLVDLCTTVEDIEKVAI